MSDGGSSHGGLVHEELARLGLELESVLDVSVNVNPYGPCDSVLSAVRSAALERYPDPSAAPARAALARALDVAPERVVVGNGAVDLLWSLARALVPRGAAVAIVEPAFSELRRAAEYVGARVVEYRLRADQDFSFDPRAFERLLRETEPVLAYICSPANPTGKICSIELLVELAEAHPKTTLIVDQSFASLSEQHAEAAIVRSERIVWLRSLTKDLALAGLRVGFSVAPQRVAAALEASRPPWSVNALAQAAAVAATGAEAQAFVKRSRERLLQERSELEAGLRRLGLRPVPSATLYSLVDLGLERQAREVRQALLVRHALLVRDASSFGLPHHLRICARPAAQTAQVIRALAKELNR